MDSEVDTASLLWADLIVFHQNIDTQRLALYQIINVNWQDYEQEIMPHSHIITALKSSRCKYLAVGYSILDYC